MKMQKTISFIDKFKRVLPSARAEAGIAEILSEGHRTRDFHELKYWFEDIFLWLAKDAGQSEDASGSVRFRYFFRTLENNPEWKQTFRENFQDFLAECRFLNFFAQTGYATEHGLWSDIFTRLTDHVFPSAPGRDFQDLIRTVFHEDDEVTWVLGLPDEVLMQLRSLLSPAPMTAPVVRIRQDLQNAILIITAHIAHHGLSFEIRSRLTSKDSVAESSFLELSTWVQSLFYHVANPSNLDAERFSKLTAACRRDIDAVYLTMEVSGVAVAVVHKLEILSALLLRLEALLGLQAPMGEIEKLRTIRRTVAAAAEAAVRGRSIRAHIHHHFYLLSRKIVERNGVSGEHYIARNPVEMRQMLKSAIGGGIIVVIMTIFKTMLLRAAPAPIFLASGLWVIYAAGFLAMQFLGFTLATKIPSFTASHLAKLLKSVRKIDTQVLVDEIRQVSKSQGVALIGNLIGVIPFALILALISKSFFGHIGLMDQHYATHVIQDINPIFSGAILLGALTGVELWLSSLCGGWFENWIVFKGFPDVIAKHPRLRKVFGAEWAQWASDKISHHASGVATNISLGFLFGFVPLLGVIIGVNLGGHHVTISTAAATFAFSELGSVVPPMDYVYTVLGLIGIGLMNFFVSFLLALGIAANAQKMNLRRVWFYLRRSRSR
jgi:site-specific recombinase